MLKYLALIPVIYLIIGVAALAMSKDIYKDSKKKKEKFMYYFFMIPHEFYKLLPMDKLL